MTRKRSRGSKQTPDHPYSTASSSQVMWTWLKDYRFLATVYCLAIPLAIYEASRDDLAKSIAEVPAEWLLNDEVNFAKTMIELYPNRSYGHFLRAYQAGMCWDNGFRPKVCETFPYRDLRDVRAALQQAIDNGGSAEQEELFHFYAYTLVQQNELPEVVEDAIRVWRKNFPYSTKPDPRLLPRAQRN